MYFMQLLAIISSEQEAVWVEKDMLLCYKYLRMFVMLTMKKTQSWGFVNYSFKRCFKTLLGRI